MQLLLQRRFLGHLNCCKHRTLTRHDMCYLVHVTSCERTYMVKESVSFELQLFLHKVHMIQLCLSNTHQLGAIPGVEADMVDWKAGYVCHQDLASGPFPNHDGVLRLSKASSLSKAAFDQQERVGLAGSMEEVPSYLKVSACMLASKLYLGSTCRILARFGFAKTYTAHCTERNQN